MKTRLRSVELFIALSLTGTVGLAASTVVNANEDVTVARKVNIVSTPYLMAEDGEGGELSEGEQANADFQDKLSGAELLTELQQGGYVIYFRHAQTEKDYADQVTADVNNCSTQRTLSKIGWQQAKTIGAAFEEASIPIDKIISSEYCRAWQTADIAFGQYEKNPALNFLPFKDYTEEQVQQMRDNVMPLLTDVPESGMNTVIVGHDDIFESATGIYPDPQGMAYVLKPNGQGSFELIANMLPEDWSQL